jgi:hypothetical protein
MIHGVAVKEAVSQVFHSPPPFDDLVIETIFNLSVCLRNFARNYNDVNNFDVCEYGRFPDLSFDVKSDLMTLPYNFSKRYKVHLIERNYLFKLGSVFYMRVERGIGFDTKSKIYFFVIFENGAHFSCLSYTENNQRVKDMKEIIKAAKVDVDLLASGVEQLMEIA